MPRKKVTSAPKQPRATNLPKKVTAPKTPRVTAPKSPKPPSPPKGMPSTSGRANAPGFQNAPGLKRMHTIVNPVSGESIQISQKDWINMMDQYRNQATGTANTSTDSIFSRARGKGRR